MFCEAGDWFLCTLLSIAAMQMFRSEVEPLLIVTCHTHGSFIGWELNCRPVKKIHGFRIAIPEPSFPVATHRCCFLPRNSERAVSKSVPRQAHSSIAPGPADCATGAPTSPKMNGAAHHFGQAPPPTTWQEFKSPDGRVYYFNPTTKVTQWTKPEDLMSPAEVCRL